MCLRRWRSAMEDAGLNVSEGLTCVDFLAGFKQLGTLTNEWEAMGLPTDDYTLLNACIITRGFSVAVVIDPHGFGADFIRAHERSQGRELLVVSPNAKDAIGQIKFAAEEGIPVLLEGIEGKISPHLSHLMSRHTFVRRKQVFVHIGDQAVLYNEGFKMYVTTADENPDFSPDISMWVTLVDFDLTKEGFNMALRSTILREKAAPLYWCVIERLQAHIDKVDELEVKDLKRFFLETEGGKGTVLNSDEQLNEFASAIEDWMLTRRQVLEELRQYRKAYARAELVDSLTQPLVALYSCLWEMRVLHPSYQTVYAGITNLILSDLSTESRQEGVGPDDDGGENEDINMMAMSTELFEDMCIGFGGESGELDEENTRADLETLSQYVVQAVFYDLIRSIYEKDHLIFTFAAAVKRLLAEEILPPEEWQHFLTDGVIRVPYGAEVKGTRRVEIGDGEDMAWEGFGRHGVAQSKLKDTPKLDKIGRVISDKPAFDWLSEEAWAAAKRLCGLLSLTHALGEEICDSIVHYPGVWEPYFTAVNPVTCMHPAGFRARISSFQELLLLRAFHPGSVLEGMRACAKAAYGIDAFHIPPTRIKAAHEDSKSTTPLLFLLGAGSDPTRDIEIFAKEIGFASKLTVVESNDTAVATITGLISQNMVDGYWVLVRNVHSNEPMMRTLERKCAEMIESVPHKDFRLWLTSFPTGLSKMVYRQSMRIVWEAPTSLRGNLLQAFTTDPMTNEDFFHISKNSIIYRKCLFAVCFLHAAVKERSVYGALGWNNPPDIDGFDLKYCMVQVGDPCVPNRVHLTALSPSSSPKLESMSCMVSNPRASTPVLPTLSSDKPFFLVSWIDFVCLRSQVRDVIEGFDSISVKSLRQLVSDLVYSGRIRHSRDEMTLESLSAAYFSDKLLNEGHTYSSDGIYYPPEGSEVDGYIAYVDALPTSAPATLFGLPTGADFLRAREQASSAVACLREMQGGGFGVELSGSEFGATPWLESEPNIKAAKQLLKLLPPAFDVAEVQKVYPLTRTENRNRVLIQELQLHNVLTGVVRSTLERLIACMQGDERLDSATDAVARSVYEGSIPDEWIRHSFPSDKPLLSYMRLLAAASAFFQKWVRAGIPSAFWMPAFFFPQSIASASAINFCRHEMVGVERVILEHIVLQDEVPNVVRVPITDGAFVTGLTLVGAGWDRRLRVLTCQEDAPLGGTPFPALQLKPRVGERVSLVHQASAKRQGGRGRRGSVAFDSQESQDAGKQMYSCPVYRTSTRQDSVKSLRLASSSLVLEVNIPCAPVGGEKGRHVTFVKRGAALVIQGDE